MCNNKAVNVCVCFVLLEASKVWKRSHFWIFAVYSPHELYEMEVSGQLENF